ncbi:general secretion pathway protein I [Paracidovorax avenae ATCC 19860]|uniref:General secretion pathway protein I n=1 Tax=Paracidovorax avenae (strain ATCC 19860 / DSM 7227 / CCUG 15838 / JCM 20985 / LMG 2117 / NCPPB 1011) TaxID=643561 RepID=F0Q486_PARA1|nr:MULTISPECIES: prepilin-type N-terminal cleavage/methylation domain-containing protein [Comamonadaceae]ADX47916.1 general secretion pathway protein I [Paracidovorax avenae ATCC 19860]AVS65948.1 prepilin-type N-terminal cleavage/methylation domain-containing protein [Paracidovorax avenae]MDA8448130.1 prepilin-type N-terminal cleavage/methylation domain-containing protein [Acidovorax sp. GBBC 3297]MDA8457903.1 prepilin-type N-terminal cleavage/methylation domain-containing protein [Acidovorax s
MTGPRRRGQQGLTLLELLVAFAIMALAMGMLYRAMGGSARSVADVDRYQRAVVLAQSLLALRDAVPEQGWNQSGESAGYQWRIASAPYPTDVKGPNIPPLHEVSILISWSDGTRTRTFELSTLRPQRRLPEPGRG